MIFIALPHRLSMPESSESVGEPKFYRILGDSGRLKTICLIGMVTSTGQQYHARGAVVCGKADFRSKFSQERGDSIALQRAKKVLEWFEEVGFNYSAYMSEYGNRDHFGTDEHPISADKLQLLRTEDLETLLSPVIGELHKKL